MSHNNNIKPKIEHLIFVKNVPGYMAKSVIPELFEEFEPLKIKDVYPDGNITTVVVSFRTYEEAQEAQEATDGLFLENVVLRVEMYSKHQSVRFLREGRYGKHTETRTVCDIEEDDNETAWEDSIYTVEPVREPEVQPKSLQTQQDVSGTAGTWAQIAKKAQKPELESFPAPKISNTDNEGKSAMRGTAPATPHLPSTDKDKEAFSESVPSYQTRFDASSTSSDISSDYTIEGGEHQVIKGTSNLHPAAFAAYGISASWEPIDSTERIRQRHIHDCAFCKKRKQK